MAGKWVFERDNVEAKTFVERNMHVLERQRKVQDKSGNVLLAAYRSNSGRLVALQEHPFHTGSCPNTACGAHVGVTKRLARPFCVWIGSLVNALENCLTVWRELAVYFEWWTRVCKDVFWDFDNVVKYSKMSKSLENVEETVPPFPLMADPRRVLGQLTCTEPHALFMLRDVSVSQLFFLSFYDACPPCASLLSCVASEACFVGTSSYPDSPMSLLRGRAGQGAVLFRWQRYRN